MGGLLVRLHEATKPGTSTDSAKISPHTKNRRREPRTRPTTSYEARKSASTARASHDTTCPPNTPRRGTHASMHLVRHTNPTAHTENCGDKPFRTCPRSQSQQSANAKPTQSQREASETSASPDQSIGVASSFQTSFA
ncbi:Uncharacterised protein [Chlamydia trachomatis]|nr:Uncharacterised protein [Chlamydia trachomatis]